MSALFLGAVLLGILRLQASVRPNEYAGLYGSKQQLEGYIVEEPDIRLSNQFLTVQPNHFSQRVLVTTSLAAEYAYGDRVVVSGSVKQPENFEDFNYQKYLERFNVYAVMGYPKILVLKNHRLNMAKDWLLQIKRAFAGRIGRLLPEPRSSLLMGILIGARKTLPQDIIDNFNATGTSHIIAISGYNISIIANNLAFLSWYLGRRARLWLTLLIISGFVILAGASSSVVRAAIMGSPVLFALAAGRQYAAGPALFFSAGVMLLVNPRILYWDASFQLSFLATLGIIYFVPLFERLTEHWPNPFHVKDMTAVTLAAIIATLPLILFTFGRLSVVAPLVNLLILPIVPLTMLLGFLSVLPWVGSGCAFAADILLRYILNTIAVFSRLPYGNFLMKTSEWEFAVLGVLAAAVYFGLWKAVLYKNRRKPESVPVE